jgi:stearoyl-CoA desaturase (delta-9 desaturase)
MWMNLAVHVRKVFLPVHLLAVCGLVLLPFVSPEVLWLTLAGWTLFSGFGIAVGYHRLFSHRGFKVARPVELMLLVFGAFGAQGSSIFWCALHRGYHHPYSDTERDIHSPIHGKLYAYMGWIFELKPDSVNMKYAVDLMRDPLHLWVHKNYVPLLWVPICASALVSWKITLYFFALPMMMAVHQENLVDLFCHTRNVFGYRNHETRDNSMNNIILGLFGWGQGWHNNHHKRPADWNFGGERWYEFDPCRLIIPLIARKRTEVVA